MAQPPQSQYRTSPALEFAARDGDFEEFKRVAKSLGDDFMKVAHFDCIFTILTEDNRLEIFDWIIRTYKGHPKLDLPTFCMNAVLKKRPEMLNMIYEHMQATTPEFPDYVLTSCIDVKSIEMLRYVAARYSKREKWVTTHAVEVKDLKILQELVALGFPCDIWTYRYAEEKKLKEMAKWLRAAGLAIETPDPPVQQAQAQAQEVQ